MEGFAFLSDECELFCGINRDPPKTFEHGSDTVKMLNGGPPNILFFCHYFFVIQRHHTG